ncbi:hypothetical protein C1H46_032653 [Malus baccata]|uniref:Uncharacterized protein n=1 Tax=Malus baccata TaxID=106549 RepID=A0A540L6B3_MALBA|nr:hypothetical protein C1H46_032653 [Malus baccata]
MAVRFLGSVLCLCEAKEQVVTLENYSVFAVAFFVFMKIPLHIFCQRESMSPASVPTSHHHFSITHET